MTGWETDIWGNTTTDWLIAIGIIAAIYFVLTTIRALLRRALVARAGRGAPALANLVITLVSSVRTLVFGLLAVFIGLRALDLPASVFDVLQIVLAVVLIVQAAIWGNHIIAYAVNRSRAGAEAADPGTTATIGALALIARIVLWSLLFLMLLSNLGIDVTAVVAGLGIGGIAVALAAQNILSDLFSSLSIMLDRPFVVGDFIIVGTEMGVVEHIGMKTTRVRSLSGEQLVFSNADLLQSRIRNYQRLNERRIVFTIGVTYQTTHHQLEAIPGMLRTAVEAQELARFDRAHFARYGDSTLEFEIVYHVLDPDFNRYMDVQEQINLHIHSLFEAAGIEFAYPTRTLYLQHSAGIPGVAPAVSSDIPQRR